MALARVARVQTDVAANRIAQQGGPQDTWSDQLCMQRLVSGDITGIASQQERDRMNKRVRRFRYSNGVLYRVFTDASNREVPWPAKRTDIVRKSHDDS